MCHGFYVVDRCPWAIAFKDWLTLVIGPPGAGGYFIQTPGAGDGDAATSEGLFVYEGTGTPSAVVRSMLNDCGIGVSAVSSGPSVALWQFLLELPFPCLS